MENNKDLDLDLDDFELSTQDWKELGQMEKTLGKTLASCIDITYEDIYASLVLNEEIIITIPEELEERIKTGLKNFKSKLNARNKEAGLPADPTILYFVTKPSDIEGAVDLTLSLMQKNLISVLRIKIPDSTL